MPETFQIPDLRGRSIVVTGGNSGIGAATVRAMAEHEPASIFICSRRVDNAKPLRDSIERLHASIDVRIIELDLTSFANIKACAATISQDCQFLDLLFLNAGVSNVPHGLTKEGYEIQFGVNHVGHALFTQLLMPKLQETARARRDVRVIVTASGAANAFLPKSTLALSQMKQPDAFSPMTLYSHSKLANVLFASKMAQMYPEITTTSAHPGFVKSPMWKKSEQTGILNLIMKPILWTTGIDCRDGAKSQLWCALADKDGLKGVRNGAFYFPVGKIQSRPKTDVKFMNELWAWTNAELKKHGMSNWP